MNKENIEKAREVIRKEIDDNMKLELGTSQFSKLCMIKGELDVLISILDNPNKYEKSKRMFND